MSRCRATLPPRAMSTTPSSLSPELLFAPHVPFPNLIPLTILIQSTYRSEGELAINIRKATSIEETAPKRKHVRSCIVYTWDHKSSGAFWAGMKVLVYTFVLQLAMWIAAECTRGFPDRPDPMAELVQQDSEEGADMMGISQATNSCR